MSNKWTKTEKEPVRLVTCYLCRKGGGTLIKVRDGYYKHVRCFKPATINIDTPHIERVTPIQLEETATEENPENAEMVV